MPRPGLWLFLHLVTAFAATRFIGLFESTIQQLVALATLMPVVASIGGNTGNQTVALVIRGLAFDQLPASSRRHLLRKELTVSVLNGLMWGGLVGVFAALVYRHLSLGIVMAGAVLLNLVIAAIVGVAVPLGLQRLGRDPAQGASVLLPFVTDSMGFFLFQPFQHGPIFFPEACVNVGFHAYNFNVRRMRCQCLAGSCRPDHRNR